MCSAIVHRGPDDEGLLVSRVAGVTTGLGMRRLAIIDTAGGQQPIYNEDESVAVVLNGEIYNYPALRDRLIAAGHQMKTTSDTEVLVHLYEEHGDDLVHELNGMFAFAILDRKRKRLLLGRDRLGIKPLYILEEQGAVLFGSEMKSLTAVESLWPAGRQIDPVALQAMLTLMYVPTPRTIYRGVRKLGPGRTLAIDLATMKSQEVEYWNLAATRSPGFTTYDDARDRLDDLLADVVKAHLVSDVPVGAFVSGGVDSSLVASYASRAYQGRLQTFSVGFTDAAYDETKDALFAVRRLQTPHNVEYATYDALYALMPEIFSSMDEPFGDSSMLPTFLVSRMAAARVKVVLSGDGGDEAFAGYTKHTIEWYKARLGVVGPAVGGLKNVLRTLPKSRAGRVTEFVRKAEKAARGLTGDDAESWVEMARLADEAYVSSLLADPPGFREYTDRFIGLHAQPQGATSLQRTQYTDTQVSLLDDMLVKVDRMSMLASLEVRVPLLDHRVVEFGYHLPDDFKLQGRSGKRILKDLYCRHFEVPRYQKKKQGFGVPIENWFQTRLAPLIAAAFDRDRLSAQGIFDPDTIGGDRAFDVARRAPFVFWNALMVQLFLDLQVEGKDDLLGYL
jgi:asparagine synthase (glutamine-hydrolysing)